MDIGRVDPTGVVDLGGETTGGDRFASPSGDSFRARATDGRTYPY